MRASVAIVAVGTGLAGAGSAAAGTVPALAASTTHAATTAASTPAATATTAASTTPAATATSAAAPAGAPATTAPAATTSTAPTTTATPAAATTSTPRTTAHKRSSSSGTFGSRPLWEGLSGHDVSVLQADLTLAGYQTPITGYFGRVTKASVNAFKRAVGLTPDGVVGWQTIYKLKGRVVAVEADGPIGTARINSNGTATAPIGVPTAVRQVIAAANQIIDKPYVYGGGHASFYAAGYDCSGSVSYALHGAGLLSYPEASTALESWGSPGAGKYITVYANSSHAFLVVSGRAFDTADFGGPNIPGGSGPRWRSNPTGNLYDGTGGYVVRHPAGL